MLNKALIVFYNINHQNIQANVSKQFDRWRQLDKIKKTQFNSVDKILFCGRNSICQQNAIPCNETNSVNKIKTVNDKYFLSTELKCP